jgi:PAS domain S-box-containing protein
MKDQTKTKGQLIDELRELRLRNTELEKLKAKHKKMEKSLEESQEKYRNIVETITDGIITFDMKGVISSVNNSFLELTGFPRDKIVGRHFLKLPTLRLSDIPRYIKLFNSMIIGKIPESLEFLWIHKDGTERWGEGYYCFLRRGRKKVGIQAILKDITERKKAEKQREKLQAQLIHSEKMAGIGTLTSGIAHEFNNLLQIMSGHTEFAQRTKKPEDMKDALAIVTNTSERATRIIKDLLTFSRRKPLERKPCNIAELTEFVLSMTEEQLKKHNIKLVREYRKVPNVDVNKGELQQVFLNLVTNARDASYPEGEDWR